MWPWTVIRDFFVIELDRRQFRIDFGNVDAIDATLKFRSCRTVNYANREFSSRFYGPDGMAVTR